MLCATGIDVAHGEATLASTAPTAPYLLTGAPTFDTTVTQFREQYNSHNPTLLIGEFRALEGQNEPANLTRVAGIVYMTALLREFKPTISEEQRAARVLDLLGRGQGSRFLGCAISRQTMVIKD